MTTIDSKRISFLISKIASYLVVIFAVFLVLPTYLGIWSDYYVVVIVKRIGLYVVVVAYLFWRSFISKSKLPSTGLGIGFSALGIAILISWINSIDHRIGLDALVTLLNYGLLLYLLLDAISTFLNRNSLLYALISIIGFFLAFACIETYLAYQSWWTTVGSLKILPPFPYRFFGLLAHPNSLMALANLVAPIVIVMFYRSKGVTSKVFLGVWIIFFIIAVPFSSSRSSWLSTATWVSLFTVYIIWQQGIHRKVINLSRGKKLLVFSGSIVGMGGLVLAGLKFLTIFASHPTHGDNPFGGRGPIWKVALDIWKLSPITGVGPGRFGLEYLAKAPSIPPNFWAFNAHSLYLQILAENGILGLIGLLSLIFLLFILIYRKFFRNQKDRTLLIVAAVAGLLSWFVQNIFDAFIQIPTVMVSVIIFLSWLITGTHNSIQRSKTINIGILWVPSILSIAFFSWVTWSSLPDHLSAQAAWDGNYELAIEYQQISQARDPQNDYYSNKLALLSAAQYAESKNPASLQKAIDILRITTVDEASPSLFLAELSVLEEEAGELENARDDIAAAIMRAPSEPSYYINQGAILEKLHLNLEAENAYCTALKLQPDWGNSPFWTTSQIRNNILSSCSLTINNAVGIGFQDAEYWQKARLAMQAGNLDIARQLLAKSQWIGESPLAIEITYGMLFDIQGENDKALKNYENAIQYVSQPILIGDRAFAITYPSYYNREKLPFDLVPTYLQLQEDVGQFDVINLVKEYYKDQGDISQVNQINNLLDNALSGQVYFSRRQ